MRTKRWTALAAGMIGLILVSTACSAGSTSTSSSATTPATGGATGTESSGGAAAARTR